MQKAIETTMVFFSCAVCDSENGSSEMKTLNEDLLKCIRVSGMPSLYTALIKDKDDDAASSCDRGYSNAAYTELTEDGLLKDAIYVCKSCVKQLPKPKKKKKTTGTVVVVTPGSAGTPAAATDAATDVNDVGVDNNDDDNSDDDAAAAEATTEANDNDNETDHEVVDNDFDAIRRGYDIGRNNGVPMYALVNGYFRGMLCYIPSYYYYDILGLIITAFYRNRSMPARAACVN